MQESDTHSVDADQELLAAVEDVRGSLSAQTIIMHGWTITWSVRPQSTRGDLCIVDPRDGQKFHSVISLKRRLEAAHFMGPDEAVAKKARSSSSTPAPAPSAQQVHRQQRHEQLRQIKAPTAESDEGGAAAAVFGAGGSVADSSGSRIATASAITVVDGKSDEWRGGAHELLVARYGMESNALIRGLLGLTRRCDFHCFQTGRPLSAPQMASYLCAAAVIHDTVVAAACFRHVGLPQAALGRARAPSHVAFTELLFLAVEKRMEGHGYGECTSVATHVSSEAREPAPTRVGQWPSACRAPFSCAQRLR